MSTQIAAYYFPNYHTDARNREVHGEGWTEWELMRRAVPRWPGHRQPRVPLEGYADEADPEVMQGKIDAARAYGIDGFLFDWYYYNDGPFLHRALDEGFLAAPRREDFRFALMWANHDWMNIHPASPERQAELLYPGAVDAEAFDRLTDLVVERYFSDPGYWKIAGCPWFCIYEVAKLIHGLGGVAAVREALDGFREKTRRAGFPGLHLTLIVSEAGILPGEETIRRTPELLRKIPFDSLTSYIWLHHRGLPEYPESSYREMAGFIDGFERELMRQVPVPFFPNVTVGWDSSPRTAPEFSYRPGNYPYCPVMYGSPEEFGDAVGDAVRRAQANEPEHRIVTVNAWNEWTEGSYLEPDTLHEWQYLRQLHRALPRAER